MRTYQKILLALPFLSGAMHNGENFKETPDVPTPSVGQGTMENEAPAAMTAPPARARVEGQVDYTESVDRVFDSGENEEALTLASRVMLAEPITAGHILDAAPGTSSGTLTRTVDANLATLPPQVRSFVLDVRKMVEIIETFKAVVHIRGPSHVLVATNPHYLNSLIGVSRIEDYFPYGLLGSVNLREVLISHTRLTSVDLSPLSNVTHIGDAFLVGSCRLATLDLNPLRNVTRIGNEFLFECFSLTTLDLSPLSNVTEVGSCFLFQCRSLSTLDISVLSNLIRIGNMFLSGSCETLHLGSANRITQIENCFLLKCNRLTNLDLGSLRNVTQIGGAFLARCSSLRSLDLSSLSNVVQIGESFLSECSSLTSLDLNPLSNVTRIDDGFLSSCTSLTKERVNRDRLPAEHPVVVALPDSLK